MPPIPRFLALTMRRHARAPPAMLILSPQIPFALNEQRGGRKRKPSLPTRIPNEKFLGLVLNVKTSHNAINLYHGECHVLQSGTKIGPSLLRGPHTLATRLVKVWRLYFTPTG